MCFGLQLPSFHADQVLRLDDYNSLDDAWCGMVGFASLFNYAVNFKVKVHPSVFHGTLNEKYFVVLVSYLIDDFFIVFDLFAYVSGLALWSLCAMPGGR